MGDTLRQRKGRLPIQSTPFFGRGQTITEVRRLLSEARLVTLTGVGGVGKTRLALEVAQASAQAFPDGVWFVDLAAVEDPARVAHTVAMGVDLRYRQDTNARAALAEFLAPKRLLLVLDNCEHLVDACADLLRTVLAAAPGARVLATSREPLAIGEERVWPVAPLTVPGENGSHVTASVRSFEAMALFEERAAAVSHGFVIDEDNEEAIAQLCRKLDGLPLAIELAAVRMRVLSVDQILARLDDPYMLLTRGNRQVSPRHSTLRAAVDWSYSLCSEQEQVLWARLSVFRGDFDLEAAEAVVSGDGLGLKEIFDGIETLLDQSILIRQPDSPDGRGAARYRMLETIRQYGQERLKACDGAPVVLRRRHRDYFLALAENASEAWFGPEQLLWFRRSRQEQANVWAALDFCLTQPGEARAGLRLATALSFAWVASGSYREGRYWLEYALNSADDPGSEEQARALGALAYLMIAQGELGSVEPVAAQIRKLALTAGDDRARAYADILLESCKYLLGLEENAKEEHHPLPVGEVPAADMGFAFLQQYAQAIALLATDEGLGSAVSLLEECNDRCAAVGEEWQRSWALKILAMARWRQDPGSPEALSLIEESTAIAVQFSDVLSLAWNCAVAAWILVEADTETATRLIGASEALWRPLGTHLIGAPHLIEWHARCRKHARERLGDRRYEACYEAGTRLDYNDAHDLIVHRRTPRPPGAGSADGALTRREREVAAKVAEGMSNRQIAASLVISQRTVETHVENILRKLDFTTRTQIAVWMADPSS
ncbi:ATP-binding protein [Streptomyces nigra]|uniref:ATP-binding protein n=1 Tax=Streptomyces nigra TaxID=1827580 RepID=UPI0036673D4B